MATTVDDDLAGAVKPNERSADRYEWPDVVGVDEFGAFYAQELRDEINLDYAATTPALRAAVEAVLQLLPAYGSIHRGGGARSRISTEAYEQARATVAGFVGCGSEHHLVFVRNTTEAINLVAASLLRGSRVLCSPIEHHANLLPWREHEVDHLPFTNTADELVAETATALRHAASERRPYHVLAVSGASNVSGEVLPITELSEIAREAGVQILVDGAQLAPHRRVDVQQLGVDYFALSGHKLYAPFGSGALVVRRELLENVPPLLKGGGAVRAVTLRDVAWAEVPRRLEAGTPNLLGAAALAGSCEEISRFGRVRIERQEEALARYLWDALQEIPGLTLLRGWPDHSDRVAVAAFTLVGHDPRALAERLGRDHGVAVRSGLFCAHPFVSHLLRTPAATAEAALRATASEEPQLPGAVRASIGIGVQPHHIDRLVSAITGLQEQ